MRTNKDRDNHAAQELINDPKFLFRIGKKIRELGVVREQRNRLIVPLTCMTTHLKDKVSLVLTGPSGCGKSTIPEITTKLLPPEWVIKRVSFSRKAFAYGKEPLDGKVLYVAEYRGGAEAQHLLRILQSEGELSHEYTVGGKTEVVQRLGSPVVLTTTTDESIFEDDSTRFLAIRVSEAPDKILAVLKNAIGRNAQQEEPAVEVWQNAFRLLQARAEKSISFPSWLDFVAEELPRDEVRVQRDWKRCLALLQAVALCRPQSGSTTKITFADYCVTHRIVNEAFTATTHAVSENEIAIQRAVKRLASETRQAVMIETVRKELSWTKGMAYKYVRLAVEHGLVKFEAGTREKNIKPLLPTDKAAGDFLPKPGRVLEHIGRGKGQTEYVDPLTGETKCL
jgi:energy-coupling factor transporter ATP-binding protein EcfA2